MSCITETRQQLERAEIVGISEATQKLRTQVQRLGPHFRTVLLRGEAGTGKELVARALHQASSHSQGPFVVFNPASEDASIATLMKTAHRGTVFIRQVGSLTQSQQADLLAELQRRERGRGRIVVHGLEARVVASSTENLRGLVASRGFLEELYSRLATLEIELSPLRERKEDIPVLAAYFVQHHARAAGKAEVGITAQAMDQMTAYQWSRNVAQLKELLRCAVVKCGERLEVIDIQPLLDTIDSPVVPAATPNTRLQEVVERHVVQVLKACAGNKVRAAELLGISRSTLYRMLDTGLQDEKLMGLR